MAKKSIFTDAQARRCHKLYFTDSQRPMQIAAILNAEYEKEGLKVTPRQVSEYASTHEWPARKKVIERRESEKVGEIINRAAQQATAAKVAAIEKHKEFYEASTRIGSKVMQKAEQLIEHTNSARDLSSAANAAAKGIEIYMRSVGIDRDAPGGAAGPTSINFFNFARGAESPFSKARPVEQAPTEIENGQAEDSPLDNPKDAAAPTAEPTEHSA